MFLKIRFMMMAFGLAGGFFAATPRAAAVIGAEKVDAAQVSRRFPGVVRLRAGREVCTGTIVGPRVVLSAAHCASVNNPYFDYDGQRYRVSYSSSPAYRDRQHDVAVALTDRDIAGARFAEIGGELRHGSRIEFVGFGCTRAGGAAGSLHAGTTTVIGLDRDHALSFARDGGVLCQGDSGGPAFVREGGRDLVAAVNSAGDIRKVNLNVRLDSELSREFLKKTAARFKVTICGVTKACAEAEKTVASVAPAVPALEP